MANKITTSDELKINTLYADTDTRTITLKNPKAEITTGEITTLDALIKNGTGENSILIGDKYGSDFSKITTVTKVTKTTIEYDIS